MVFNGSFIGVNRLFIGFNVGLLTASKLDDPSGFVAAKVFDERCI